jgi:Lrp/AsnC family leucine-responsive transcriptional regulator
MAADNLLIESIDPTDRSILSRLMHDGRATWADLAADLDLTAPAIAQRVRRLQERGIIRQFAAWVAPGPLGNISALVTSRVERPEGHARFREAVEKLDEVQECYQVAGEQGYVLKVRCSSLAHLGELVSSVLPKLGAKDARASVVLATIKESPVIPIFDGEQA